MSMTLSSAPPPSAETAILFAAGEAADVDRPSLGRPAVLLPLLGKPLLQRAIEKLVGHGCRQVLVVVGDDAGDLRAFLGDGTRWGCRIGYHYLDPERRVRPLIRPLGVRGGSHYWLADARCVPDEPLPADLPASAAGHPLCFAAGPTRPWTGWGLFAGWWLLALDRLPDCLALAGIIPGDANLFPVIVAQPLSAATPGRLLASARQLLGADRQARVVVGRGCRIDPGARLVAPLFIGRRVRIRAGAVVGPNVAIEDGALIGREARIVDSLVMPDTAVGERLSLERSVVCGTILANVALDSVSEVRDPLLLGDLSRPTGVTPLPQRCLAAVLRGLLLPLQIVAHRQMRDAPEPRPVTIPCPRRDRNEPGSISVTLELPRLDLDSTGRPPGWWTRHFCRSFYPGLRAVIRGELRLIGPSLRSIEEVRQLPAEWRRIYAASACGLLDEALLDEAATSPESRFASDALSAAAGDKRYSARSLLGSYLRRVLRDLRRSPATLRSTPAEPSAAA